MPLLPPGPGNTSSSGRAPPRALGAGLVDRIHARSGGNAFFVEELAAATTSGLDGQLPPNLRDTLYVEGAHRQVLAALLGVGGAQRRNEGLPLVGGADLIVQHAVQLLWRKDLDTVVGGRALRHGGWNEALG